jgi:hypothetical protein
MDPASAIGVAAACVTFAGVAIDVLKSLRHFYRDVKEASAQASRFRSEMTAMNGVVSELKFILETVPDSIQGSHFRTLHEALMSSIELLEEMKQKIQRSCDPIRVTGFHKLKWPFCNEEMGRYMNKIQSLKSTINLTLQLDQTYPLFP